MKRLFVRFFKSDTDKVPEFVESHLVCVDNCGRLETTKAIAEQSDIIALWMREHLGGKVDFVWL